MYIILSQKIDCEPTYKDIPFYTYHYPARYRNAIHIGDRFVYSQGNRYDKSQRYYFGTGIVGAILQEDSENYYAALLDCYRFSNKIPIVMNNGEYIEQLGYESKRTAPPWQSAIRAISSEAFDYMIHHAGELYRVPNEPISALEKHMKDAIKDYFVGADKSAVIRVAAMSAALAGALKDD